LENTTAQANISSIDAKDRIVSISSFQGTDRFFDGVIDEVRISNTSRSAEYIQNQWYNGINNMTRLGSCESYVVDTCTPSADVWNMDCSDNCTKTDEVITVNGPWNIYGSNGYFLCDGCTLIVNETTNNATNCKLLFTGDFKYITR